MRPVRHIAVAIVCLTVGLATSACSDEENKPEPMRLKVMEFNIEYGGTLISFDKVVEAIKLADPDVVGLEEAETNAPKLAKALGYPYASSGMHIISKHPILEPSGSQGAYALIEVRPGEVVALSNVHLPSDSYGPYLVRDGRPQVAVLRHERKLRIPALAAQQKVLPGLIETGMPTFMTGDFNAPSHLDWTPDAVGSRKYLTRVVKWPVSIAVEKMGFRDSYREAHPDPVANPGLTWWAARPKAPDWAGNSTQKDPRDRIDFVYASNATVVSSDVVGEKGAPDVTMSVTPWPSDHRAVVSTFDLTPAPTPVMIATQKILFTEGEPIAFTYRAAGKDPTLSVSSESGAATSASGHDHRTMLEDESGTFVVANDLDPGRYTATLSWGEGGAVQTTFWVQAKDAKPRVMTNKSTYAPGEPIVVSWVDAPANRWDWLGVYQAPADTQNDSYLIWQYTGGLTSGTLHGKPADSMALTGASTYGSPWPLPPGRYEVHYLLSDAYDSAAHASFTVSP